MWRPLPGRTKLSTIRLSWMKNITDLLQEGEQLRLETDGQGPQDEIEFWKAKAAHLTLVVDEMMAPPTKMTLVTLRAAKCKLLKAESNTPEIRDENKDTFVTHQS